MKETKIVATIAGSDSGGGAGIQADLKTLEAHWVFGASVITSITAQNTQGVQAIHPLPAAVVHAQLQSLLDDFDLAAIKLGMLGTKEVVEVVAGALKDLQIPVVLDPVMRATLGDKPLLNDDARQAMVEQLFPLATIITPNLPEAALLLGNDDPEALTDLRALADQLAPLAPEAYWLIKGGHRPPNDPKAPPVARDLLFRAGEHRTFESPWINTTRVHGTGCTLSSAIAAHLAMGKPMADAVRRAKTYVTDAIRLAPKGVGQGYGPLRHNLAPYLPTFDPKR